MKISQIIILGLSLLLTTSAYAQGRKPKKQSSAPTIVRPTEGIVAVYFITDRDGKVTYTKAMSGDSAYYDRAARAAQQLKLSRRWYRGQLINTAGLVVYRFVGERPVILEMHKGPAMACGN